MGQPEEFPPLPTLLADTIELVTHDHEHGASWLARQVAQALAEASHAETGDTSPEQRLHDIHRAAQACAAARPSMAPLTNTAARIWHAGTPSAATTNATNATDAPQLRLARIHDEAAHLLALWHTASNAITTYAHPVLHGRLFTHSRSGTVEQTLIHLAHTDAHNQPRTIIVSESRPGGEGVTAAQVLAEAGWQVTLVPDAAYALFIAEADTLVIGADSIRADGSIINKIGSHPLALAAEAASVPVYVLCETLKIAATDSPLILEEMDPTEIVSHPIPGVTPRNIYFERVPAHLITGIITERGPLARDEIAAIAAEAAQAHIALTATPD